MISGRIPADTQKASARAHAEAESSKTSCRTVFIGNRLLPGGILRAPAGKTGARWLCVLRFLGNQPRNTGKRQGEEQFPAQTAKQPQQPLGIAAAVFPLTHNIHLPLSRRQKYDHT